MTSGAGANVGKAVGAGGLVASVVGVGVAGETGVLAGPPLHALSARLRAIAHEGIRGRMGNRRKVLPSCASAPAIIGQTPVNSGKNNPVVVRAG